MYICYIISFIVFIRYYYYYQFFYVNSYVEIFRNVEIVFIFFKKSGDFLVLIKLFNSLLIYKLSIIFTAVIHYTKL